MKQRIKFSKSKAYWAVIFTLNCVFGTTASAQGVPNVEQGAPGTLLAGPVDPKMGRLAVIEYLNGNIITIPESPGSQVVLSPQGIPLPSGDHTRTKAWDFTTLTDPNSILPVNPNPRFGDFGLTGNPFLAHGSIKRDNEVFIGGNGFNQTGFNAIRVNEDGRLEHVKWSGRPIPTLRDLNGNQTSQTARWWAKSGMMRPWTMNDNWDYDSQSNITTLSLRDQIVAQWDIVEDTKGIAGFGNIMGNLLIYASDQRAQGMAIYDLSDIQRDPIDGETKPKLLSRLLPSASTKTGVGGKPGGVGGYWSEISGHYLVFARRHELTQIDNPTDQPDSVSPSTLGDWTGIQVVDFSDPTNPRMHCELKLEDPEFNPHRGWWLRPKAMYVGLQDEYAFVDNYKVNIETCELDLRLENTVVGTTTNGTTCTTSNCRALKIDTSQYSRIVGNVWITGGYPNHTIGTADREVDGMGVWVHQTAPDTKPPLIAHHIPEREQANYPANFPLSFSIPETLEATTIIVSETARGRAETLTLHEIENGVPTNKIRLDYVLSHQGMLTVNPLDPMKDDAEYEVRFTGDIEDAVGNKMAPYHFSFFTGEGTTISNPAVIDSVALSNTDSINIGESVIVSVSASNATEYQVYSDAETPQWQSTASRAFQFDTAGSYVINIRARNTACTDPQMCTSGLETRTIIVRPPVTLIPQGSHSSQLTCEVGDNIWAVNPDNDSVAVINADTMDLVDEIKDSSGLVDPQSVVLLANGDAWVTAKGSDQLYIFDSTSRSLKQIIETGYGTAPSQLVASADGEFVYVSLYGSGELAKYRVSDISAEPVKVELAPTVKSLALSPDGNSIYVAQFITSGGFGSVFSIDSQTMQLRGTIELTKHLANDAPAEGRGLPNYVDGLVINSTGSHAYLVAKKDNIDRGLLNANDDLDPDNTVRTMAMVLDLENEVELVGQRLDFDNASSPSASTLSADDSLLFFALQGKNQVEAYELEDGLLTGDKHSYATELAPQSLCYDAHSNLLYAKNFTSRSVTQLDLNSSIFSPDSKHVNTVGSEVLSTSELRGLQHFYNAFLGLESDVSDSNVIGKMSQEGYISCATCHADGADDGRTWDFTGRDEGGLRNNISLKGRSGTRFGNVHWSANFDEIHDFENDIRGPFAGSGLMDTGDFLNTSEPLGASKAGLSDDLDALVAYVSSLGKESLPRSPHRETNGVLTASAQAGQGIFVEQGCASCHSGKAYTDAATHDVGTIRSYSGTSLTAIKTPSLLSAFATPPYLHDGSAKTIADVFTTVGGEVIQAENSTGAVVVEQMGYSYLRQGKGARLAVNNASLSFNSVDVDVDGDGGLGKLRFRYNSVGINSIQVSVNGTIFDRIELEDLPQVSGQDVNFTETNSIDIDLTAGNNQVTLQLIKGANSGDVIIDDVTISTADDVAKASAHTKVTGLSATEQDDLLEYVLQIDQSSAPEDDDPKPMENNDDRDGDGVNDTDDNCPAVVNPNQTDADNNGIGDACESTPGGSQFYRGVNINGDAVTLDGHSLEAQQSATNFATAGWSHISPTQPDPSRSSTENSALQSFLYNDPEATFSAVSDGDYEVYAWVFEDNWNVTFDIKVNDQVVESGLKSGTNGAYKRHGPYAVSVSNGVIKTELSGAANFAAIELWKQVKLQKPIPQFTDATSELTVTLDASMSTDADGNIVSYRWNMGDSTLLNGQSVAHTYSDSGSYPVTLTVEDNDGQSVTSATKVLTVVKPNNPPVAQFISSGNDLLVNFDASQSNDNDGSISNYQWEIKSLQGTLLASLSGVTPNFIFDNAGDYLVSLTVSDNDGAQTSITMPVTVNGPTVNLPPLAVFDVVQTGLSISVDASASSDPEGGTLVYSWVFGDQSATRSNVSETHTYGAADTYDIVLHVTDDKGLMSSVDKTVVVTDVTNPDPLIQVLVPTDDKQNAPNADGNDPELNFSQWGHAFMRFSLEDIEAPIKRATLRLHYNDNTAVTAHLLGVVDDNWNEHSGALPDHTGFTWSAVTQELSEVLMSTPAYVEFDVTDYVLAEMNGNQIASFELMHDKSGYQRIGSKESNNPPELVIETEKPNIAPKAVFTVINDGLSVTVDAAGSSDPEGAVLSYAWSFGETGSQGTGVNSSHTYQAADSYEILLTVTDDKGLTDSATRTVVVELPVVSDIVTIDNTNATNSQVGSWSASGGANPHEGGSVYSLPADSTFTWNGQLTASANYDVQVYWTYYDNRTTQANYNFQHRDGVVDVTKNQRNADESGRWVSIGEYVFDAGDVAVTLSNAGQGTLSADAIRFVLVSQVIAETVTVDNTSASNSQVGSWAASGGANPHEGGSVYSLPANSTFTWNGQLTASANYDVQVYWTYYDNRTTQANYNFQHRNGVADVTKNQRNRDESGRWVSIGEFAFDAGDVAITLSNTGQGTLSADAVRFVPITN